jgi:hypothetical protein
MKMKIKTILIAITMILFSCDTVVIEDPGVFVPSLIVGVWELQESRPGNTAESKDVVEFLVTNYVTFTDSSTGIIENGTWKKEDNKLYVNMDSGKAYDLEILVLGSSALKWKDAAETETFKRNTTAP